MGNQTSTDVLAAAGKVKEFNEKPENLLLAIVYNNPDYVTQNVQSYAGVSYAMTAEQLMDWFEQYGGELDEQALYNILNVPFNPDAENVTADYWPVIDYQAQQMFGEENNDQNRTWAELFPDAITALYKKYFAGQQSTGTIGEDIDAENLRKEVSTQQQQDKMKRRSKNWQRLSIGLNVLVLVSFLAFLITAIVVLSKTTKPATT